MDAVTHVLAGFALGWLAARLVGGPGARQWGPVGGAAALAPDLDVVLAPLTLIDALYPMQHRGVTHSLLGAPISAGLLAAGLEGARRRWAGRQGRWSLAWLEAFAWRPVLVAPLLLGAWSHLLLDLVTHQGAPLLWPFSQARTSLEIYYWIIWWLAPISLVPLWLRFRGRWDDRRVMQAAAVVVVIVLVVGGVRLAGKPDGEHVFARREASEWTVAHGHANGTWRVELVEDGGVRVTRWYEHRVPDEATDAVARVLATDAYRGFRFESTAPHVVQAEAREDGWNVTVIDTVARFEADTAPGWLPKRWLEDAGLLQATVTDAKVRIR